MPIDLSALSLLPDFEAIVASYLLEYPDITGITTRIGTRTPPNTDQPWVRIRQLAEQPDRTSPALHNTEAYMQFDCYGSNDRSSAHQEAVVLARVVQAALHVLPQVTDVDCVVSRVYFGSLSHVPDADFEPARERYILTAYIHAHPRSS